MQRFNNRTVIVTGGARGIGASHARGFVAEGANVVIADVLEQEGRTLADELGDHAIFCRLDVTSDADWAATMAVAEDAFGPVSVLVNNAGIVRFGPITETDPAAWRQVIDINLTGTIGDPGCRVLDAQGRRRRDRQYLLRGRDDGLPQQCRVRGQQVGSAGIDQDGGARARNYPMCKTAAAPKHLTFSHRLGQARTIRRCQLYVRVFPERGNRRTLYECRPSALVG